MRKKLKKNSIFLKMILMKFKKQEMKQLELQLIMRKKIKIEKEFNNQTVSSALEIKNLDENNCQEF